MAYTNPYTVEDKEDSAEKIAFATGKPTKHFLFGIEFNGIKSAFATITGWINALLSSKEDKVSAVIAFGSDNYTATVPELIELVEGYKILCLFENINTGASTLKLNDFDVIEIVKEGDVQLIANDLLGVHWLMYDGVKFQVVGHVPKQFPLSLNEIAAINSSNTPSDANPFVTIEDLAGLGGGSTRYVMFSQAFGNYPLNGNHYSFSKSFAPYDQNSLNSYGATLNISTLFANGLPMLVPKGTKLVEAYLDFNGGSDSSYNLQIHTNEINNGANASTVTPNNNQILVNHTFTTPNVGFSKFLIPLTILSHVNLTEFTELFWVLKGSIISSGNNTYNPKIILFFE